MARTRTIVGRVHEPVSPSSSTSSGSEDGDDEPQEEYDVEHIRTWRYNRETKTREYFIKWRNWPEEDNTWEPEEHLNCPEAMENFLSQLSKKQKKFHNSTLLDNLSGLQRNAEIKCMFGIKQNPPSETPSTSSSSNEAGVSKSLKSKISLMVLFEDDKKEAEELTLKQLLDHRPEKAFEWIEQRFIFRDALEERPDHVKTQRNRMVNTC